MLGSPIKMPRVNLRHTRVAATGGRQSKAKKGRQVRHRRERIEGGGGELDIVKGK